MVRRSLLLLIFVLGSAVPTEAAFTTNKCLAMKLTAWGKLRSCQRSQEGKLVLGKVADLAKCQTTFQERQAKIDSKALKAGVACRYRDNGNGTITDFDTGLMWERKIDELLGLPCDFFDVLTCVTDTYSWVGALFEFIPTLNGDVDLDAGSQVGHAGHSDWRLPSILELLTIIDRSRTGCGLGGVCINLIFGPTIEGGYWSSTPDPDSSTLALAAQFVEAGPTFASKSSTFSVRAVRNAL